MSLWRASTSRCSHLRSARPKEPRALRAAMQRVALDDRGNRRAAGPHRRHRIVSFGSRRDRAARGGARARASLLGRCRARAALSVDGNCSRRAGRPCGRDGSESRFVRNDRSQRVGSVGRRDRLADAGPRSGTTRAAMRAGRLGGDRHPRLARHAAARQRAQRAARQSRRPARSSTATNGVCANSA